MTAEWVVLVARKGGWRKLPYTRKPSRAEAIREWQARRRPASLDLPTWEDLERARLVRVVERAGGAA